MYDLQGKVAPMCVQECIGKNMNEVKSHNQIFSKNELNCANNCLYKYRASMNLAMGLLMVDK